MGPGVEPGFTVVHELVAGDLRSSYLFPRELFLRVFDGRAPEDMAPTEALARLRNQTAIWADDSLLEPRIVSAWYTASATTSTKSTGRGFERKDAPWSLCQLQLVHAVPDDFRRLRFRFALAESYVEHADNPALASTLPERSFPLVVGDRRYALRFSEAETEYVFHRSELDTPDPLSSVAPAELPDPRAWALLTLAFGGLFVLLLVSLRRVSISKRPLVVTGALVAFVGLASSLTQTGRGFSDGESEAAARARFEPLLRGVYAAFARPTEGEVYDALALVVAGPLLERLYRDIYRSLIRKEHAGAVASVEQVSVISVQPEARPFWARSTVLRAEWEVEAKVEHFGHTHERRLRYRGRFEIAVGEDGRARFEAASLEDQSAELP